MELSHRMIVFPLLVGFALVIDRWLVIWPSVGFPEQCPLLVCLVFL